MTHPHTASVALPRVPTVSTTIVAISFSPQGVVGANTSRSVHMASSVVHVSTSNAVGIVP